jgi:hypothetical protein
MEKTIIKTIREAFKKAYINKLLKESSDDMARKMTPALLKIAEENYPLFISGRKSYEYSKKNQLLVNYLVEKAVEEYKQTKDDRIRQAISAVYYPSGEHTLMYTNAVKDGAIQSNLRKRWGNAWKNSLLDNLIEAWEHALGNPEAFDSLVNSYKGDTSALGSGIGSLMYSKIMNWMRKISGHSASAKRGGGSEISTLDAPVEKGDAYINKIMGSKEFQPAETLGAEDFGSDVAPENEFDVAVDTGEDSKGAISMDKNELIGLFASFAEAVNEASKDPKNRISEPLRYAIEHLFKYGETNEKIKKDRPDLFSNIDLSATLSNGLKSEKFHSLAREVAKPYAGAENWLANLLNTGIKKGETRGEKLLSTIPKVFAKKAEEPVSVSTPEEPEEDWKSRVYEETIEKNIDKIVQEVYKRLNKIK